MRIQSFLAMTGAIVVVIAIVSFFAWLIAILLGASQDDLANPPWNFLALTMWIGMPLGFAMIIGVLIISWVTGDRDSDEHIQAVKRVKAQKRAQRDKK